MEIEMSRYSCGADYSRALTFILPGSKYNQITKIGRKRGAGYTKSRICQRTGKPSSRGRK